MGSAGHAGEKVMDTVLNEREFQLARDAAEWRLISLLFECPSEAWRARVSALAQEVVDPELRAAAESALREADEGLFHYVFGPGGPAPAREATYHQTVELGYLMSDLQSFYNAFEFRPQTEEPPDHVSVETSFIAYLKLKELYALCCDDQERATVAADATKQFLAAHLSNIAAPLSGHLRDSGIDYLSKVSSALAALAGPPSRVPSAFPILHECDSEAELGCGPSAGQADSN
jgi:nitrate reductase assembly molybdenum cofactor insertion protein NarJ